MAHNDDCTPRDRDGNPLDITSQRSSFRTRPRATHPRSGKATSNSFSLIDLAGRPARFDFDRVGSEDCRYGAQDGLLCRVRAAVGPARWVLVFISWGEDHPGGGPLERELTPAEAAEWLDRNGYLPPDDLDLAPPFDIGSPPAGRLDRDWLPGPAPAAAPPPGPGGPTVRVDLGRLLAHTDGGTYSLGEEAVAFLDAVARADGHFVTFEEMTATHPVLRDYRGQQSRIYKGPPGGIRERLDSKTGRGYRLKPRQDRVL